MKHKCKNTLCVNAKKESGEQLVWFFFIFFNYFFLSNQKTLSFFLLCFCRHQVGWCVLGASLLRFAHFTWNRPRKQEMSHLALKLEQKTCFALMNAVFVCSKLTLTPSDTVLVMHCIRIAWSNCIPTGILHINSEHPVFLTPKAYNVIPGCHHVAKKDIMFLSTSIKHKVMRFTR